MASTGIGNRTAEVIRLKLESIPGATQEWLAAESGIPMRTLARRLHRTTASGMSLDELDQIAKALSTDAVSLLIAARDSEATQAMAS